MPDVSVPWGAGELQFALPENWRVQQIAKASLRAAPDDWQQHLARALNQPTSGPPLGRLLQARRKGRIAIVVEDLTRTSPLSEILELIMREMHHAEVSDENLEIVVASGMHPPMTAEQARAKIGPLADAIRWRCNPWQTRGAHVRVGRAGRLDVEIDRGLLDADLRILVSSVSAHLQAGFGGGYKMLVPGCASLETIRALHRLGVSRTPRALAGTAREQNSMRQAIDDAGELIDQAHGTSFSVQYLLDDHDRPAFVGAGEVLPTQQMLAKRCAVACGVVVPERADVLITNAAPRDHDLWQSFKCIANTRWAARPNGVIVCLARCEGGTEGMNIPRWPLSPAWTRRTIRTLGSEAISSLITRLLPHLAGDAAFFIRMAVQAVHRNPIFLVSPTLHETLGSFPGLELFATVEQAADAARAILGDGPQRVTVFPEGGITFPVAAG
ncbi:MAG TPA: hypothetical protein DCX07_11160 [Phycisphaerales bacterium]|nr:hypothetical protein [Phycisphaerales bacterium]